MNSLRIIDRGRYEAVNKLQPLSRASREVIIEKLYFREVMSISHFYSSDAGFPLKMNVNLEIVAGSNINTH